MLTVSRFLKDNRIFRKEQKNFKPAISVIMPTYCRGEISLRRSIESVLNQTFKNFEFIIVDDGSRDGTFDILKEYYKQDPRIVIIRHDLNSGLPALRVNEGILAARGKYICYQFDDDEYLPDCLQTLYKEIEKQKDPCLMYGSCDLQVKLPDGDIRSAVLGKTFNYGLLVNGNYIANNSVIHHREVLNLCGLYDPHVIVRRFSDYDLWLRMAKKVPFIWIDKMVTRVYAGEKRSLGADIDFNLDYVRRYLEIPRDELLSFNSVESYQVDNLKIFNTYFKTEEIDYLQRFEIIPFRSKAPYYLKDHELYTENISRPRERTLAVTKSDFSTSIDVTVRNYTHRIDNFPYNYFFINEGSLSAVKREDYDVLALYRTIGKPSLDTLKANKSNRKATLYMMDDNMFKFHELGEEFAYLKPESANYKCLQTQVKESDLVLSYNPIISADCRVYNNKVVELKTNIPCKYLEAPKTYNKNVVKIAMFSGMVRKKELTELWPVIESISKKYSKKVEFHFWGLNPEEFGKIHCPVYYKPFTHSYDSYLDLLMKHSFNYHICPLMGEKDASLSKSPVKFLEGTVAGAVGIFSNVSPYSNIPDNLCFKTENSPKQWYEVLEKAILQDEEERLKTLQRARKYVISNYSTESQAHTLIGALEAAELHSRLCGKKIAYFFHESYLGGATLHLLRHATFARELGFEVLLCLPNRQKGVFELNEYIKDSDMKIQYLEYKNYVQAVMPQKKDLEDAAEISKWFVQNDVGLAHAVTYIPAVGIAGKMNGIPIVSTLHQIYPSDTTADLLHKNKIIDIVHSSSNRYARQWSDTLGVASRRMCCPVDARFFGYYEQNIEKLNADDKVFTVLVSGTLQERKNQLEAIKAVAELRKRGCKVQLDVIGYDNLLLDYSGNCRKVIDDENLHDCVKIWGFTNKPETFYNNKADVLLCCSTDESMPQTILQAMAAGLIIVTTEVGGVNEIVKNNYSCIVSNGHDAASLADALEKVIKMGKEEKAGLLSNAHKAINMIARPDFIKAELINLYNEGFEKEHLNPKPDILKEIVKDHGNNAVSNAVKLPETVSKPKEDTLMKELRNRNNANSVLCGSVPLKTQREYLITAEEDNFSGLRLLAGTHQTSCTGTVTVKISSTKKPDFILRQIEAKGDKVLDNSFIDFRFDPIARSKGQEFIVIISYLGTGSRKTGKGGLFSVYEYAAKGSLINRIRYRLGFKGSYSLYGQAVYKA